MGLNVMTNDSEPMDDEPIVEILCSLLKILKSDNDTICSNKTVKELIVSCFDKDLIKYVNCSNEVKNECEKITVLPEEKENIGTLSASKRSEENQNQYETHLEFYFTCFFMLFFLVVVGIYHVL